MLLCFLLLWQAGCKGKEEPVPFEGNVPPPQWTLTNNYDMSSSMTVIVKVDLALTYKTQVKYTGWQIAENDLLAAFDGENCIGIAQADNDLFFLYVTPPLNGTEVKLAYYSAQLKNLFYAQQTITFRNDDIIGTVSDPVTPQWTVTDDK